MTDSADLHFARFCARGEPADLGLVFDQTALELLAVAEHLTRDFAMAEDLVQSTFLVAIQSAPGFRAGERVRPWLVGILRNLARRGSVRAVRNLESTPAGPIAVSAAHTVEEQETSKEVRSVVAGLPQPYREVVELRLFSGFSNSGIAARLRRPPGTVRSQLSRGLEMLRLALPAGIATGVVCVTDLSAMRLVLLRAAENSAVTATGAATVVTITGVFMNAKLLASTSLVLLAALLGWWILDPELVPAAPDSAPRNMGEDQQASIPEKETSIARARDQRTIVPPVVVTRADELRPAPEIAKKSLLVQVVDREGHPVPDARVHVSASHEAFGLFGLNVLSGRTMSASPGEFGSVPPSETVSTDVNGHATIDLHPLHTQLIAGKPSVGQSGKLAIPLDKPGSDQQWRVELRPSGTIRGRVLDEFGRSIEGARVVARSPGSALSFMVVETKAGGSFVVEIPTAGTFYVSATKGEQKTESVGVHVDEDMAPQTVELCVPGAFEFVGVVRDPIGKPAAGAEVIVWRVEEGSRLEYPFSRAARTAGDGSYRILLGRAGTYRIVARSKGVANSTFAEHKLTEPRPRVDSVLRLQPFAEIRGTVVSRGKPLIGVGICADVGVGVDSAGMSLRRIYGPDPFAKTGTDDTGAFTIKGLHPDAMYRVTVFLDPKRYLLTLCNPEVRAGTTDLRFVANDDQRSGAVLHCCVKNAQNNRPIGEFGVRLWKYYDDGPAYPEPVSLDPAAAARGEFIVRNLAIGAEYSLVVQARGFAPLLSPRFRIKRPEQIMDLALHDFTEVVLLTDGTNPASRDNPRITITRQTRHPEPLETPPVIADASGRATLKLPPGKFRATCGKKTLDFEVVPGRRLVVQLR